MTVTLNLDTALSRVTIDADGLADATTAQIERSTNQVVWDYVRGGINVPIVAGSIPTISDYEFVDGVTNYYRVRYVDTITYVASGAAAHADNAVVQPGLPPGAQADDLLLIWCATRSSAQASPTPAPTGYTELINWGNTRLHGKIHSGSESDPTLNLTGAGGAGMTVSAQMTALRGTADNINDVLGEVSTLLTETSNQEIQTPALTPQRDNSVIIWMGWKRDDWTTTVVPGSPVVTKIGDPSSTLGDDQGISWGYWIQDIGETVGVAFFDITGGAPAVSRGVVAEFFANSLTQESSIVPTLDGVWLKSLGRPFLNRQLNCVGNPRVITRRSRTTATDIIGRSLPIGTSELATSRSTTIPVVFRTTTERLDFNVIIGTGDPLFFHTPINYPLPTMYVVVDDTFETRPVFNRDCNRDWRRFELPLREVATPGASVIGSTGTWQTVIDTYDTWADVLADKATWLELLELVGSVSEVVVP